jgi:hypothetical protein
MRKTVAIFFLVCVATLFVGDLPPAHAQAAVDVTLLIRRGTTHNFQKVSSTELRSGRPHTLTIFGQKEPNGTHRPANYCVLRSTNMELLRSLQQSLVEAKTKTTAICQVPASPGLYNVVDLDSPSATTYFVLGVER